jgi:O-antigen ligase
VSGDKRAAYDNDITRFGIYSAISLFAALSSIWAVRSVQTPLLRRLLYAAVAICAAVAVVGLVFSQTRAAWLATAVVIALCIGLGLRGVRAGTVPRKPMLIAAAGTVLVLVCVAILFRELLTNRLLDQAGTIVHLLQGGWSTPPEDPVGYRITAYREGLLTWLEAPWFGHGPGIDWFVFRNRSEPALDFLMHFHNVYINLLATWGVVGFMLFAIVFGVLVLRACRAHVGGFLPTHTGMFLLASTVSLLLFGLFDQILLDERMPFLLGILGAIPTAAAKMAQTAPPESVNALRPAGCNRSFGH